jgi:uncharacterized protein (TIGR03435 family)
MNSDKDSVKRLGEYLRDRQASQEEEQSVLDRVWQNLRPRAEKSSEERLPDFKPAAASSTGRLLWVGAAAAVVLGVVMFGVRLRSASPAVVTIIEGSLDRVYEKGATAIRVGERLAFGEPVRSGSATNVVLTLKDGSQIEMRSNSELALERADDGVRIRLGGGGVLVSAAKQRTGHLYVRTRDLNVSVAGTVFLVNAEEAGSRVAVLEGEVQVQQSGESRKLLPGQQVVTNPLMEEHPVVEQVAWSRTAEPHLAMLQQPKRPEFDTASLRRNTDGTRRFANRTRCRGIDGELRPVRSDAPVVPLGRCVADNATLSSLLEAAYDSEYTQISGLPSLGEQPSYHLEARADDPTKATKEDLRQMLQNLLADRLKLKVHRETKELDGYVVTIARVGVKFKEAAGDEEVPIWEPAGPPKIGLVEQALPTIVQGKFRMRRFVDALSGVVRLPIIDKTGLTGLYDMTFSLDLILGGGARGGVRGGGGGEAAPPQEFDPPLPKAMEEQLGLLLERGKVPVEYLIVDHVEEATDN